MTPRDPILAKANAQARLRRGMFLLPSLFTVGNIAAGYFSITQTIAAIGGIGDARQHLDWAAIAILIAIPLDSLDGRIARMTNTCSDFGKELDSLADAITFGMAPSLLALIWGFHFLPTSINPQLRQNLLHAGAFICFLFLIGGVSRLAAAGLLAASVHLCFGYPNQAWWVAIVWLAVVGMSGFLMVSTWRFWSGKEISLSRRHPFQILFQIAILLFVIWKFSQVVLFSLALVYMFSGIWARAAYSWSRRRRRGQAAAAAPEDPAAEPGAPSHL